MIFGRDKAESNDANDVEELETTHEDARGAQEQDVEETELAASATGAAAGDGVDEEVELTDAEVGDDDDAARAGDEWSRLDESRDWRYDGPFDISEVDLDQDVELGIERVNLGSLIVTPEEDIAVQLQIQQETGQVQALVAMHENSGLEVALFAAPARSSMLDEVRAGLFEATAQTGGSMELAEGPFGTEVRRLLPLEGPDGETYLHPSRLWMVQGPRWLLRGVLMGEAGMQDGLEGSAGVLLEFFRNIVVARDSQARVPGDLVPLSLPPGVTLEEQEMPEGEPGAPAVD